MKTELLLASESQTIERAAAHLRAGRLVVFPTDTLYGVGADAFSENAIAALYRAKGRSFEKGIPILLADTTDIEKVAENIPAVAHKLLDRFWPGPLTLIVPRRSTLPPNISPNENIAVRLPDSAIARSIIRAAGGALATTSANRSGERPAHNAAEARKALDGLVAAVVDGGPVAVGIPSTIVDCTGESPRILRQGPLAAAALSLDTA
jgi:L-threonylcarbamoyladenylate synthase